VTGCRITVEGRLTHLRLDGTKRNALGLARYTRLREVASGLTEDDVLLFSAEGPDFCAGQDLVEFEDARAAGQLLRSCAADRTRSSPC
jgi:enoyl-CoA hydratase/carnithine racemase